MRTDGESGGEMPDSLPIGLSGGFPEIVGETNRTSLALLGIGFMSCDLLEPRPVVVLVSYQAKGKVVGDLLQRFEAFLVLFRWMDVAVSVEQHRFVAHTTQPFDGTGGTGAAATVQK